MSDGASDGARIDAATPRRPQKSEAAFRTISEVSEDLDVPQHVLRFWESRFQTIKPLKRGGGRRYYRPEDVQLLRRIRDLLYKDGYTIRGVQKLLREQTRGGAAVAVEDMGDVAPVATPVLRPAPAPPAAVRPVASPAPAPVPAPTLSQTLAPSSLPASDRPGPAQVLSTSISITGARRALLETLVHEIDELRKQLADATKKPGK